MGTTNAMRPEAPCRQLSATAGRDDMERLHALCGARLYSISTLAGLFPDLGWHQPGEMGGVWAPPIKLLDGFWIGLRPVERARAADEITWLRTPESWRMAEDGVTRSYRAPTLGVQVTRRDWIAPGESVLVVEVTISPDPAREAATTLACGLFVRSDLHGAWLSEERLGWVDGEDRADYRDDLGAVTLADTLHPEWSVCVGATAYPATVTLGADVWGPERASGRGVGAALWYRCEPVAERDIRLRFVIAGSFQAEEPAAALFSRYAVPERAAVADAPPQTPLERAHDAAIARFRAPFERCVLRSPDERLDEAFAWAKAAASWLRLDAPGLGSGLMAGLPDFAWWFSCDTAFGAPALLPVGMGADVAAALSALARISRRDTGDGVTPHEVVTNGVVFARGNLVEAPLFARALYHTYRWTGDRALLDDLFPFCAQGVLEYALTARLEDGEHVPQGRSIVETPDMQADLQTLDVGAYLVEALDLQASLARDLGRTELAGALQERAELMRAHLRADWWLPAEDLFGDVRASRSELQALLNRFTAGVRDNEPVSASIERLRRALADADDDDPRIERQPWLLHHYVQALAADAGLPDTAQATALLGRLEREEWVGAYGLVLNALNDRQVMTLPTGALAVGEARYARADAALVMIQRLIASFGADSPGTLSEYSPSGGCFLQLWSSYGLIWPVVHYFFGLRPDVATRRLICAPQLPSSWPEAELRATPLGASLANVTVRATPDGVRVVVEIDDPTWEVSLGAVVPDGARITAAAIGETEVALRRGESTEPEGRGAWLAPAQRGASRYELRVSWSAAKRPHTGA